MEKHIIITAANDTECMIFIKHIVMVQKLKDDSAFIYTTFNEATVKTKQSYEDVIEMLKEA